MAIKSITPTKSNYTTLKDELKLAKEGHGLLEQKREVFVLHLTGLMAEIREKRELLNQTLTNLYRQLAIVRMETNRLTLNLIVKSTRQDFNAEIIAQSVMGVPVPRLVFFEKAKKSSSKVPMGISETGPSFDKLFTMAQNMRKLLAEVAGLESAAWRLALEIKKNQRRVNALENFVIPDTNDTIKYIKDILEEKDRETLFQIKRVKANSQRKEREDA